MKKRAKIDWDDKKYIEHIKKTKPYIQFSNFYGMEFPVGWRIGRRLIADWGAITQYTDLGLNDIIEMLEEDMMEKLSEILSKLKKRR